MLYRVDLHMHTDLDPIDGTHGRKRVTYDPAQAIAAAKNAGLDAIAFTHHQKTIYTPELKSLAARAGIILIPGIEASIHDNDVVILNPLGEKFTNYDDLAAERARNPDAFILAPHPFYGTKSCLGKRLLENIALFDAVEYSSFRPFGFNFPNQYAAAVAEGYGKPLIATSDAHDLRMIGSNYTLVESASPKIADILASLRNPDAIKMVTKPFTLADLAVIARGMIKERFYKPEVLTPSEIIPPKRQPWPVVRPPRPPLPVKQSPITIEI